MSKRAPAKRVTAEELQAVRDRYATVGPRALARELGVAHPRIVAIARKLGISMNADARRQVVNQVPRPKRRVTEWIPATDVGRALYAKASSVDGLAPQREPVDRQKAIRDLMYKFVQAGKVVQRFRAEGTTIVMAYFVHREHADAWSPHLTKGDAARANVEVKRAAIAERYRLRNERRREERIAQRLASQDERANRKAQRDAELSEARKAKLLAKAADRAKQKAKQEKSWPFSAPAPRQSRPPVVVCDPIVDTSRARLTIAPAPRGRFEVDPDTCPRTFSALKPGQYLEEAS